LCSTIIQDDSSWALFTLIYAWPIQRKDLEEMDVCALALGDQVILDAIQMEDMDLIVEPARMCVSVNPDAPDIPVSLAKGVRK
jgi:hypothetical protein